MGCRGPGKGAMSILPPKFPQYSYSWLCSLMSNLLSNAENRGSSLRKKKRGNGHEREQEVELQPLPSLGLEGGGFGQVIEKVGESDVWWGLVLPLALLSRTVRWE